MPPRKILLLIAEAARHIGTVQEHIRAFEALSRHRVVTLDSFLASRLDVNLEAFDAVVFHYSIVIAMPAYLPPAFRQALARFRGPRILFIQDEYRWVNRTVEVIRELAISTVFTVVNQGLARRIYRDSYFDHVRFEYTLTGFVPEPLIERPVPPYASRPIDVSYRARKVPSWLGRFGQQKWEIGDRFLLHTGRFGLSCDIATTEASRIYGERWVEFIANSKATLGTESGASFIDFNDSARTRVEAYEAEHPDAGYEEVHGRFLAAGDGDVVINVISPRAFEAAALRTLQILYPGDYSGILVPGRHYVPLLPDHSNIDEVVAILRSPDRAGEIIDNAYNEIARARTWTSAAFIEHFDRVSDEECVRFAMEAPIGARAGGEAVQPGQSFEQEIERLRVEHARALRRRGVGMLAASVLERTQAAAVRTLSVLPAWVSGPVARLAGAVMARARPLIKRLILGRE